MTVPPAAGGAMSPSVLTPSLVEYTATAKKRLYQQKKSSVPDAAAFNEYIRSQQQRDNENGEIAKEGSQIAKD